MEKYAEEEVTLFFLGSDMEEHPYYLLSARQMLDAKDYCGTIIGDF